MDYTITQPAIVDAIRAALGWGDSGFDGRVVWTDSEDSSYSINLPKVEIELNNIASLGNDETRYEYDESTDRLESIQVGNRTFSVTVKVTSDSACGNAQARYLSDLIRTRIRRPSVLAILSGAGLCQTTLGVTVNVAWSADHRNYSATQFDIGFAYQEIDTPDDGPLTGDYFTDVEITGNPIQPGDPWD